ncbi:MAG: 1-acyl-sn-glycerol-3-phosphate acyltransferase [Bacilli bacterium]|nr:1-acyl-sn-glycerol-3-phosphate acyltransferase [Bacilli bacterium]
MFLAIFLNLQAIAATLGLYFGLGLNHDWYWFWVIIIGIPVFYLGAFIVYLIVLFIASQFISSKKERKKINRFATFLIKETCVNICLVCRVRIHRKNWKSIPKDTNFVLVSNHLSVFDNMCALAALPTSKILCISKGGNFKIPIAGKFITLAGYFSIDRDNQSKGIETIEQAEKAMLEQGVSIYVNPEGTRSKDHKLHEFHNGTFRLVTETKRPLVVMSVENTWQVSHNFPLKPTHVHLDIVDIVPGEECATTSTADLALRAYNAIAKNLDKHQVFVSEEK